VKEQMINLEQVRSESKVHILSGRDKGDHWRIAFKIDELDQNEETVHVRVPEDVYLISISFFLGLFGDSVRHFGSTKFLEKYLFEGNDDILPQVEDGIKQALKKKIGLPEIR
jgi:hypothetical protein